DPALLEDVRDAVARAGLEPGVGDLAEAERVDVVEGRLERIADVELDVVDAVERHEVLLAVAAGGGGGDRLLGHGSLLLRGEAGGGHTMIPLSIDLLNADS